jgi:hypothetical protein
MRSTKFAVTLAALALGTALTTLPALAQDYHYPLGRGANDGGTSSAQLRADQRIGRQPRGQPLQQRHLYVRCAGTAAAHRAIDADH